MMKSKVTKRKLKRHVECRTCDRITPNNKRKMCIKCANERLGLFHEIDNVDENELNLEKDRINKILTQGINKRNEKLLNQGCLKQPKNKDVIRIATLNPQRI